MNNWSLEVALAVLALAASAILLVLVIILSIKLGKLRRILSNMTAGASDGNLEQMLTGIQQHIRTLQAGIEQHGRRLDQAESRLDKMKGHVSIHRYNAFSGDGRGSDLSFSVAIVDDDRNGVVLTAIHGREQTFVYGKPVEGGSSKYKLTPEEMEAIGRALGANGDK